MKANPTMIAVKRMISLTGEYLLNELNMAIEQVITATFANVEIKELQRTLKDDFNVADN